MQSFRERPCLLAPPSAHCFKVLGRIERPREAGSFALACPCAAGSCTCGARAVRNRGAGPCRPRPAPCVEAVLLGALREQRPAGLAVHLARRAPPPRRGTGTTPGSAARTWASCPWRCGTAHRSQALVSTGSHVHSQRPGPLSSAPRTRKGPVSVSLTPNSPSGSPRLLLAGHLAGVAARAVLVVDQNALGHDSLRSLVLTAFSRLPLIAAAAAALRGSEPSPGVSPSWYL